MAIRILIGILSAAALIGGILPLFSAMFNSGVVTLITVGTTGLFTCAFFPQVQAMLAVWWHSTVGCVLLSGAAVILVCLLVLLVTVSINMVLANARRPSSGATVVVLGAALHGDRPSRSLRVRLDAAVRYLRENPAAVCVVSGGQGRDEPCTEAAAMRAYLLEVGIAEERIYTEDRSTSTYENILFSKELIREKGLSPDIAIATQEFHQYRAQWFAKRAGITRVGALTARSRWDLIACYWMRDFFGICRMYLLGE